MSEPTIDLLLVDDDEIDREMVCRLLLPNYTVREAATGQRALTLVQAQLPDCVLLDYRLPDINGLQLLPALTQAALPVILLTGEENPATIVQAMQQGAQDYLVKKQLSPLILANAIGNAIEKARLKREVEAQHQQLRALAVALTLAEQQERRRIADLLHDHIQQMLYALKTRAHLLRLEPAVGSGSQDHLVTLKRLIDELIGVTRQLTVELSPPLLHDEGLAAALQWLARHMHETHQLQVVFEHHPAQEVSSADVRLLIFQLVRELLFNVVKHAGVQQAKLVLWEQDNQLRILVADEGRGFAPEALRPQNRLPSGLGLTRIGERLALFGGRLELATQPGQGVRTTLIIPLSGLSTAPTPEEG
jgi:signal transduction histidine kinase